MKRLIPIIISILLPLAMFASPMGTKIDIDVSLLLTSQFTVSDFYSGDKVIWTITVRNHTDEEQTYFMEIRLDANNVAGLSAVQNPAFWIVTHEKTIAPNAVDVYTNRDLGESDVWQSEYSSALKDLIESTTYLPAGNYDIKIVGWAGLTWSDMDIANRQVIKSSRVELLDLSWDHAYVDDGNFSWASRAGDTGTTLKTVIVNTINLIDPVTEADVASDNPVFQWDSPGFRQGVLVDYRLRIVQYNPDMHSNYSDALADANSEFLDTDWDESHTDLSHVQENGSARRIRFQFPSGDRDLACGYQYVWQVEAREFVESMADQSNKGIWGWPEPVKSEFRVFNYGSKITQSNISSPNVGGTARTVLPIFNWSQIQCASEYEIWLSRTDENATVEDPPMWRSDAIQSIPFSYPRDAEALIPGIQYSWKVRMNPTDPSPWSDVVQFRIQRMNLIQPANGDELTTVLPQFNADIPTGTILELRISDENDQTADNANIFTGDPIVTLPYDFPPDATTGLFPGNTYYWKFVVLDDNGNLAGTLEDYPTVRNFKIKPIELLLPQAQAKVESLTPLFRWEGPTGIARYEFRLGGGDDSEISSALFREIVNGTQYQYLSPEAADYALEYNKAYYWTVVPLDANDNQGPQAKPQRFSTLAKPYEPAPQLTAQLTGPQSIYFQWNAVSGTEYYHLIISEEADLDEDGLLSTPLWEKADITMTTFRLTPDEQELAYNTQYYAQVVALKEGERHSLPSPMVTFTTQEEPGTSEKPGFTVDFASLTSLSITVSSGVTGATGYKFVLASDQALQTVLAEFEAEQLSGVITWDLTSSLDWETTYFIRAQGYKSDLEHGLPSEIVSLTTPTLPGATDQAQISQVTIQQGRTVLLRFQPVTNASSYRVFISSEPDVDDGGKFQTILWEKGDIGVAFVSIDGSSSDTPLSYSTTYYIQVQGEREGEAHGLISAVVSFTTGPQPLSGQVDFSFTFDQADSRIVTINLVTPVDNAEAYVISTALTGTDAFTELVQITGSEFPYTVRDIFQFSLSYKVHIIPLAGTIQGRTTEKTLTIPAEPGLDTQPIFTLQTVDGRTYFKLIITTPVQQASAYKITISENQDMSPAFYTETISATRFPYTVSDTRLQFTQTYHVRITPILFAGEGRSSIVQSVTLPAKPGANETLGLLVNLPSGSIQPIARITNSITGATYYQIQLSTEPDISTTAGSVILYTGAQNSPKTFTGLTPGQTYYFQARAYDEAGPHGIPSTINSVLIPSPQAPSGGTLIVSPSTGEPGATVQLTASDWQTATGGLLSYQFLMRTGSSAQYQPISTTQMENTKSIAIGSISNIDYYFKVIISDQYGNTTTFGGDNEKFEAGASTAAPTYPDWLIDLAYQLGIDPSQIQLLNIIATGGDN